MRVKTMWRGSIMCGLALLLALVLEAAPAQADRDLLSDHALGTTFCLRCPKPSMPIPPFAPPPDGQIEGPCGLAIASNGDIYLSDYYYDRIEVYGGGGGYLSQISGVATKPEGPCGLAFSPDGALYANIWHESVVRIEPTRQMFDSHESTGVAVDGAGNVYSNDRTYVAAYGPSGAPLLHEGQPLQIGLGSLGDAYGLAVFGGRVYVADAADQTVKVFEPSKNPFVPVLTIDPPGGFNSLVDAAVAVDSTNGNVLVLDNLKPGYEHPVAMVYEFDSTGTVLDELPGSFHGEPSGLVVDPATGRLLVTDGNSEEANVFEYGPYTEGSALSTSPPGEPSGSVPTAISSDDNRSFFAPPESAASPSVRSSTRQRQRRRCRHLRRKSTTSPSRMRARRPPSGRRCGRSPSPSPSRYRARAGAGPAR